MRAACEMHPTVPVSVNVCPASYRDLSNVHLQKRLKFLQSPLPNTEYRIPNTDTEYSFPPSHPITPATIPLLARAPKRTSS